MASVSTNAAMTNDHDEAGPASRTIRRKQTPLHKNSYTTRGYGNQFKNVMSHQIAVKVREKLQRRSTRALANKGKKESDKITTNTVDESEIPRMNISTQTMRFIVDSMITNFKPHMRSVYMQRLHRLRGTSTPSDVQSAGKYIGNWNVRNLFYPTYQQMQRGASFYVDKQHDDEIDRINKRQRQNRFLNQRKRLENSRHIAENAAAVANTMRGASRSRSRSQSPERSPSKTKSSETNTSTKSKGKANATAVNKSKPKSQNTEKPTSPSSKNKQQQQQQQVAAKASSNTKKGTKKPTGKTNETTGKRKRSASVSPPTSEGKKKATSTKRKKKSGD